jgi:hypothetical protein
MCDVNLCNVFMLLFMVLWVPTYRDSLQAGSADAAVCLPVPWASVYSSSLLLAWWPPLLFLVKK